MPDELIPLTRFSADDHDRILHAINALREFHAGYQMLGRLVASGSHRNDFRFRFLYNSLHSYLYGFYAASPNVGLIPILSMIGLHEQLAEITAVLDRPVGTTNVRGALQEWRNVVLAHPTYSIDIIHRRVLKPVQFSAPEKAQPYAEGIANLLHTTADLFVRLRDFYGLPADDSE